MQCRIVRVVLTASVRDVREVPQGGKYKQVHDQYVEEDKGAGILI
jgi:hypothetical protein